MTKHALTSMGKLVLILAVLWAGVGAFAMEAQHPTFDNAGISHIDTGKDGGSAPLDFPSSAKNHHCQTVHFLCIAVEAASATETDAGATEAVFARHFSNRLDIPDHQPPKA